VPHGAGLHGGTISWKCALLGLSDVVERMLSRLAVGFTSASHSSESPPGTVVSRRCAESAADV